MSTMKIGGLTVASGELQKGGLVCGYLPTSAPVEVPFIVARGRKPGPTVWVGSLIHGPEIGGIELIRHLVRERLDLDELSGTVLAVPVCNPFGYLGSTTDTPQDGQNINRVFPGSPTGQLSNRVAHVLTSELMLHADYVVDVHTNMRSSLMHTVTSASGASSAEVLEASEAMALAYGMTRIWTESNPEDETSAKVVRTSGLMVAEYASTQGMPSITVELVDAKHIDKASVAAGVEGMLNILGEIGMLTRPRTVPAYGPIHDGWHSRRTLLANRGGYVEIVADAGEWVNAGRPIANIRDPWGDVVEEVVSPVDGFPLAYPLLANQHVTTGDTVAYVAFPHPAKA